MTWQTGCARGAAGLWLSLVAVVPATALPTMIRLGYADCAACHVAPQGGGPLNTYGRGIDQGQSLRGGEYVPSTDEVSRVLTMGGRISQDLRAVFQEQGAWTTGRPSTAIFRPRLMYRNVTALSASLRASVTVTGESESAPRPSVPYDPSARPSSLFVNTALLHYQASKTLELAGGRDQLPTGINVPDLALFIKARNRLGYYDAPAQVKLSWNGRRAHVMSFGYGAGGGNDLPGEGETGAGAIAEVDVLGRQKSIVGVTSLRGVAEKGSRRTLGIYTRLGFGAWGILAEHDVTDRTRTTLTAPSFRQTTSYAQAFWAIREWLVASAIAERLRVDEPFPEHLNAGKFELVARLSSHATVGLSGRFQRDARTSRAGRSVVFQAALKTVQ